MFSLGLIPHYGRKAGFAPGGLVLAPSISSPHRITRMQSSHFTTARNHGINHWESSSNQNHRNTRCAPLPRLSALTFTPRVGFSRVLFLSCAVSFSLIPFLRGSPLPSALKLLPDALGVSLFWTPLSTNTMLIKCELSHNNRNWTL